MLREKGKERIYEIFFLLIASLSIVCVLVICVFLFGQGIPAMQKIGLFDFLTGTTWNPANESNPSFGIFPMILGSIYITAGAIIVGVPIGVLTAIFMTKYCPDHFYKFLKPVVDLMAGIPSIIYGFFGMTVMVPFIRDFFNGFGIKALQTNGLSIFTASLLLGFMILPTVINLSESAIRAVPDFYYEGSRALGATHEKAVFQVVLPAAKSGVLASVVLGIGRAIGETMAVIMVAGNQARITTNILSGIRTLTANVVIEMAYAADLHKEALIATGVVLFVFILIINLCFSIVKRKVGN
ncbi:phosphate ABC transporter permease subunit PstC [Chakrabartyella piscis]|uniref:phosphate ABC transporter permease subunit PstC n=1 Tax=Chakrabartyella piscis TaxID=2918914 RepID=UPI0029583750|nr:phosphate ABC transporter permease subunit PstC [Chakrabartyella piscis]